MLETCQNCFTPSHDVRDGKCEHCRAPQPKGKKKGKVAQIVGKVKEKLSGKDKPKK